jgi:methylmalonyl-CoA/ethylmalonyl-CoA epimerase
MKFNSLDHIAIVVANTEESLGLYRDKLGCPVLFSEVLEEQGVRLTHLELGNVRLQLVQPLSEDHPLQKDLLKRGEALHHLCFQVDSVPDSLNTLPESGLESLDATPRRGPRGRQSAFINPDSTRGVLIEITAGLPVE